MLEQCDELELKVIWQPIETTYTIVGFRLDSLPCIVIITGQQNLDEIGV